MFHLSQFTKLANTLDELGLKEAAELIDARLIKAAGDMYIPTKELPSTIQDALKSVGYHSKDIAVKAADKVSAQVSGGEGRKGFVLIVDLASGEKKMYEGSWGGANMFNPNNAVDLDNTQHEVPQNSAVIKGSTGYGGTYAVVYVRPETLVPLLPTSKSELTPKQKSILGVFKGLISSYRPEALKKLQTTKQDIEDLIAGGYLKRNAAGSIMITTLGKNNAGDYRGY